MRCRFSYEYNLFLPSFLLCIKACLWAVNAACLSSPSARREHNADMAVPPLPFFHAYRSQFPMLPSCRYGEEEAGGTKHNNICMGKCFLSFLHDLSVPTACFVCRVQFSHGSYPVGNAVHLDITLPFSPEKNKILISSLI